MMLFAACSEEDPHNIALLVYLIRIAVEKNGGILFWLIDSRQIPSRM